MVLSLFVSEFACQDGRVKYKYLYTAYLQRECQWNYV